MFRFFARLRLRVKFSLIIIGLVIAIIGGVLFLVYSQQKQSILAEVKTRALDLTAVLAFAGVRASLEDNYLVLQELVDSISNRDGVRQAMVLNTEGRVMVHNYTAERGKVYSDALSQRMIHSPAAVVALHPFGEENVLDVSTPIFAAGKIVACARVMVSLKNADQAIKGITSQVIVLGLGSTGIALVLAAFLSGLVINPLSRLYHAARRISQGAREVQIDVTAHDEIGTVQQALKTMIEELHLKAGLAALGTTAANLAHEIRTPLNVIMRYINDLTTKGKNGESHIEMRQKVLDEINRLNDLVKQLLVFSQKHKLVRSRTNMNDLIEQALFILEGQLQERRILTTRDFAPLPIIAADKNLLQSVFMNLISNAIDAMESEGNLYIQTRVVPGPELTAANEALIPVPPYGREWPQKSATTKSESGGVFKFFKQKIKSLFVEPSGRPHQPSLQTLPPEKTAIVITITDNGHGIPAEIMDQLFLPFVTTKKHGTGLGLALSHKIIQEHQGAIRVQSQEGKGTTFTITLPI